MRAATAKNVVADLGNVVGNSDLSSEYLRTALTDTDNGNVVSAVYSGGNMKAATAQKAVGDLGNVLAPSDLRQEYFRSHGFIHCDTFMIMEKALRMAVSSRMFREWLRHSWRRRWRERCSSSVSCSDTSPRCSSVAWMFHMYDFSKSFTQNIWYWFWYWYLMLYVVVFFDIFVITVYEKDYVSDLPTGPFVCSFCLLLILYSLCFSPSELNFKMRFPCSAVQVELCDDRSPGAATPPGRGGGLARPTFQSKFAEADSESEMSSSDEGTRSAHTGNLNNARSLSMINATSCKVAAFVVMASPLFTRAKAKGFSGQNHVNVWSGGIATTTVSFLKTDPPFMLFRGFFWCFPTQKADVQASNLPHRFFQFWQMDPTQKAGLVTLQVEFRSEAWQATS